MRFVIFTHSLVSDWNHGNAHFLRGIATELVECGHELRIFEPSDGWSLRNLVAEHGTRPVADFESIYPKIRSRFYSLGLLDLRDALDGAEIVIVHEWNEPDLVKQIGEYRKQHGSFRLFFHDTHHRSATDPASMAAYDLRHYDGVLAYGAAIRRIYCERGWAARVWTWHEAADTRVFFPRTSLEKDGDVVWIGNWGDGERSEEIHEYLISPIQRLGLKAKVYGVRYPQRALDELAEAGIEYGGWLPNYRVPEVFSRYRATIHIPRRAYTCALPGIPTIRPFEALACGIPLISVPWRDTEGMFRADRDLLWASNGQEVAAHLEAVLSDSSLAERLAECGAETIRSRHTCSHRVDQLLEILAGEAGVRSNVEANSCA